MMTTTNSLHPPEETIKEVNELAQVLAREVLPLITKNTRLKEKLDTDFLTKVTSPDFAALMHNWAKDSDKALAEEGLEATALENPLETVTTLALLKAESKASAPPSGSSSFSCKEFSTSAATDVSTEVPSETISLGKSSTTSLSSSPS